MESILEPARFRINEIHGDFVRVTERLSKPVQFIQMYNENAINAHISDIFSDAAQILQTVSLGLTAETKIIQSPNPQMNKFRLEIERLYTDLDRKTRLFDSSVANAQKMFSEKVDILAEQYKTNIAQSKLINQEEEEKVASELQNARDMFNQRLKSETESHIKQAKELEINLTKLKNEYELQENTLSTSIDASRVRLQLLKKQKEMLAETNDHVTITMNDKFKQQIESMIAQNKTTMDSLQEQFNSLIQQKSDNIVAFAKEAENLQYQIEHIDEIRNQKIKDEKEKIQLKYEKKLRKLEAAHQLAMKEISHQTELERIQSESTIEILRNNIETTRTQLEDADRRYKDKVDTIMKRGEMVLAEKSNEMKMISKVHIKTLEQLTQQADLDVEQEKHKAKKLRHTLENKLNQILRESDATRKKLEAEITALTRARDKFEEEMKAKESIKPVTPPPTPPQNKPPRFKRQTSKVIKLDTYINVSFGPEKLSEDDEIAAELLHRAKRFYDAWHRQEKFSMNAIESYNKNCLVELERLKLQSAPIEDEIELLELEKQDLLKKIADAERRVEEAAEQDDDKWEEKVDQYNKTIAEQQTIVMKLKEDINAAKANKGKKEKVSVIEEELKAELLASQKELDTLRSTLAAKDKEMRLAHEKDIQKIQTAMHKSLDNINKRIDEVDDAIDTAKIPKDALDRDHNDWMVLRKEMADSSNKINRLMQASGNSRPPSVVTPGVKGQKLPPLAKK